MARTIAVDLDEVRRVFDFLEQAHDLLHQPMKYQDPKVIEKFAEEHYDQLKSLYYHVVWNWLPAEVQREIEER